MCASRTLFWQNEDNRKRKRAHCHAATTISIFLKPLNRFPHVYKCMWLYCTSGCVPTICDHLSDKNRFLLDAVLQCSITVKSLQCNHFWCSFTKPTAAGFLQSINEMLYILATSAKGKSHPTEELEFLYLFCSFFFVLMTSQKIHGQF